MTAAGCSTGTRCEAPGTTARRASGIAGDQGAGLGRAGDLVVRADEDEGRHADPGEFGPYVERGQRLARGDVAAGVGGTHHLDGPLGDRGLRGGEPAGEPAVGRGAGDGVEPVGAHDHPALAELVRRAEAGRGGDQRQRGHALRVAQDQFETDRAAERAARVAEALHAEGVERGQQPVGQVGDRAGRVRGRAAVARQVVPEDPPLLRQLGHLAIEHVPGRPEGRAQDENGRVFGAVEAVLEGKGLHVAHRPNVTAVSYDPAVGPPVSPPGSHTSVGNPHIAFTGQGWDRGVVDGCDR